MASTQTLQAARNKDETERKSNERFGFIKSHNLHYKSLLGQTKKEVMSKRKLSEVRFRRKLNPNLMTDLG